MAIMEKMEKVELVREKSGASYEDAKRALEENGYEVLDAIIALEREAAEKATAQPNPTAEEVLDIAEYEEPTMNENSNETKTSKAAEGWKKFCKKASELVQKGAKTDFIAERDGERIFTLPVLVMIIGLLFWGATLWLLIIGLFFGLRYRIEGAEKFTVDVNAAMDKAADVADDIKNSVA